MKMEMGDTEAELPGDEGDEDEDEDYDADDTAEFRSVTLVTAMQQV